MLTRGGGVPKRESDPHNEHHDGRKIHEPMNVGAEANLLTRLQNLSYVAHSSALSGARHWLRRAMMMHALRVLEKVE